MNKVRYKTTTGTIVFRIIFLALLAAAITAVALILSRLWRFLESYETSQTYHVAETLSAELENGNYSKLFTAAEMSVSPYETDDEYKQAAAEKISGEISYSKSAKESRADYPVYVLKADDVSFAYARLCRTGEKTEFGFDMYKLDTIYGLEVEKNEYVTVNAPSNCSVYINDILVTVEPDSIESYPDADNFVGFLENPPTVRTYKIDGLINAPTVKIADKNGDLIATEYDESKKSYSCELQLSDAAAAEEAKTEALEFSHLYTEYAANDITFDTLATHMDASTELYADTSGYDGKYAAWHSAYRFSDDEIVSVTQYSDSCFAVRVRYVHIITFGGKDYEYPNDNTVYLVKNENKWTAVNLIMN